MKHTEKQIAEFVERLQKFIDEQEAMPGHHPFKDAEDAFSRYEKYMERRTKSTMKFIRRDRDAMRKKVHKAIDWGIDTWIEAFEAYRKHLHKQFDEKFKTDSSRYQ